MLYTHIVGPLIRKVNPIPTSSRLPCDAAADTVSVNTNDAFMGIDSERLSGGTKSFPPAFDAGENYYVQLLLSLRNCPEMYLTLLRFCFWFWGGLAMSYLSWHILQYSTVQYITEQYNKVQDAC